MSLFHGLTDAGLIVPIRLDASRNLQVTFDTAGNPIKVYGEEATRQVKTTMYGGTVAGLKQSSLPLAYYDGLAKSQSIIGIPAAYTSTNLYVGAPDEVAVFTNLNMSSNASRAAGLLYYGYNDGVATHTIFGKLGYTAGDYYDRQGEFIIAPGKILVAAVVGGVIGDNIYFSAMGYKFKV